MRIMGVRKAMGHEKARVSLERTLWVEGRVGVEETDFVEGRV